MVQPGPAIHLAHEQLLNAMNAATALEMQLMHPQVNDWARKRIQELSNKNLVLSNEVVRLQSFREALNSLLGLNVEDSSRRRL